jgi:hypothetical protein
MAAFVSSRDSMRFTYGGWSFTHDGGLAQAHCQVCWAGNARLPRGASPASAKDANASQCLARGLGEVRQRTRGAARRRKNLFPRCVVNQSGGGSQAARSSILIKTAEKDIMQNICHRKHANTESGLCCLVAQGKSGPQLAHSSLRLLSFLPLRSRWLTSTSAHPSTATCTSTLPMSRTPSRASASAPPPASSSTSRATPSSSRSRYG